ncbi:hypothetical protein CMO83_00420 [Candidatus Woesearchaeota archaeon]|jgi:NAD+ kinase|nr:hypothetical protein [Candidatus Woesearchaeota archaeon]MDP6648196.1 NAD(+)/NADH kinase [Candidatus Woesearchaeota archaeon]|tara:strand:+ start:27159 stop:28172 length:1014 start_codon:yes stop_codon:yes gene_type:complete
MYFITSKADRESLELARRVVTSLKDNDIRYSISKELSIAGPKKELSEIDYELIIAIGDDGFILKTFRKLGKLQIPVFAIASMQSFLSQANALNFKHYINLIKKNRYATFRRSRLVARFDKTKSPIGLNDISLFSSKSASLLKYTLKLNEEVFWRDTSDGLVIATPTGSTGYSLSAGGPIILDEPNIFSLTSISSLEKHSPIIISDSTKIKITDIEGYKPNLVIDGEARIPVTAKEIVVEKSPYNANFIVFSKEYSLESKLKKRTIKVNIGKLKNMPASSKLIYKILMHEGSMTQKELISASLLPERTVRYALGMLLRNGLISHQIHFTDARQTVYGV